MSYGSHYLETGHDPIVDWSECFSCAAILRRIYNEWMPELPLGPNGWDRLFERIRELARSD